MAKPEQLPSGVSPEEGLLEKAAKRIEEAPGTDEGRAAIAKVRELLALPEDNKTREETPIWDWQDREKKVGSEVVFKGNAEQGVPRYTLTRIDGRADVVTVDALVPDPRDPLKLISEGLVARSETFNAQGELIGITVNTFDQRGMLEKQRRERKLNDGSKTIETYENRGRGRVRYMDPSGREQYRDAESHKSTEILMGPDGKLRQARIEEVNDDERASMEFIDTAQGTKYIYNKALGISRVERLAA